MDVYSLRDLANVYDGSLITEDVVNVEADEIAKELELVKRLHESNKPVEPINTNVSVKPSVY